MALVPSGWGLRVESPGFSGLRRAGVACRDPKGSRVGSREAETHEPPLMDPIYRIQCSQCHCMQYLQYKGRPFSASRLETTI